MSEPAAAAVERVARDFFESFQSDEQHMLATGDLRVVLGALHEIVEAMPRWDHGPVKIDRLEVVSVTGREAVVELEATHARRRSDGTMVSERLGGPVRLRREAEGWRVYDFTTDGVPRGVRSLVERPSEALFVSRASGDGPRSTRMP